jgi:2',3'-cyclic-nucleotide 2'-phosphodiesterase (5'-nucleotidase family)
MARRAWLVKQLETNFPETPMLMLDAGNFSDNPTAAGDIKTRGLVQAMGQLGYRVANIAERDLIMGYDEFRRRTEGAGFPFISANFVKKGTEDPVFDPYVILDVERDGGDPIRVGVIGVVRFNSVFLKPGPSKETPVVIAPPLDMVKKYLDEVREKSDLVIVLAAVHRQDARVLAASVEGIDFVLGSYGAYSSYRDEEVGQTRIFYSGNQGKRLAETRVFMSDEHDVTSTVTYQHYLSARYPGDLEMQKFVNQVFVKLNELKKETKQAEDVAKSG